MSFKFRLTFDHASPGVFRFDTPTIPLQLEEGLEFELCARDCDTLVGARRFHIDGSGYEDEDAAHRAGERLRVRLRLCNAMLGLGIRVPIDNTRSGALSNDAKQSMRDEFGIVVMDCVSGLTIFPDDGKHREIALSTDMDAHSSGSGHIVDALEQLWPIDVKFNEQTEVAVDIINSSTIEPSPRARFLLTYFALEQLVKRKKRNKKARQLLKDFQQAVSDSDLDERETASLIGALAQLNEQSFSSALMNFAEKVRKPTQIGDLSVKKFFSKCIDTRHRLAHKVDIDSDIDLDRLSADLRSFLVSLIWKIHGISSVSVDVPASALSLPKGGFQIRWL